MDAPGLNNANEQIVDNGENQQLLVSEYPPPPYYFTSCSSLTPPPIPVDAFKKASNNAKSEIMMNAISSEVASNDLNGVVGVFGEIVEDPSMVYDHFVHADEEDDPKIIYDKIKSLNTAVLERYVELVNDMVYRPKENKGKRDELSENLMKMMEESNRFRSHQAREILIEVLELRLKKKKDALNLLKTHVSNTESLL